MTKPTNHVLKSHSSSLELNSKLTSEGSLSVHQHSRSPRRTNQLPKIGKSAFSLTCMFQVVTACCIFFAVMKTSPLLALIGTLIATPAIIRTALAAELYRRTGIPFTWLRRLKFFLESTGLTVVTAAFSIIVFVLVSMAFGLLCMGASLVLGMDGLSTEIAFIGTVGGMVWGAAGGIVAFTWCARRWHLEI